MTEPTDAELQALWAASDHPLPQNFARAVLAKWGTPAPVGAEPVALLVRKNSWRDGQWEAAPPNSPSYGLAWANQRVYVYTTQQPTQAVQPAGREPEFDQFLSDVMTAAGLVTHGKQCKQLGERLGAAVMMLRVHGIKGGQHVD